VIPSRFRAGEYPGSIQETEARGKLRWLLEQQTDFFLDLTEAGEYDLKPYKNILHEEASQIQKAVLHKRIPINDLSTPVEETMVGILDTIDLALSEGRNIYMHCFGGKGRTGTVVGCYLARHGMPGKGALEMIQELRRNIKDDPGHSPETEGQRRMVLEWTKGR
jgi:protein-tyrosine phosphatase